MDSALRFFEEEFRAQMGGNGPVPIGRFVGPRSTRRGAQLEGLTPTAVLKDDFIVRLEPAPANGGSDGGDGGMGLRSPEALSKGENEC